MHTHDLYSFETDDPSLAGPFRRASEVPEPVRGLQLYVLKPRIQRSSPDPTQPTASVVPTRGKSRTVEVFQPPSAEVFKTLSGNHTQLQGLLEFVDNAIEAIRKKQIESRAVSAAAAESSERAVPLQTHKQVTPKIRLTPILCILALARPRPRPARRKPTKAVLLTSTKTTMPPAAPPLVTDITQCSSPSWFVAAAWCGWWTTARG